MTPDPAYEYRDISPPISEATAVWPGDVPFTRRVQLAIANGANIDLSALNSTVHIGAHADAPSHYISGGAAIDAVPVDAYIGPCFVTTCTRRPLILPEDAASAIASGTRRVLFRTLSQPDWKTFPEDFVAFAPETIATLAGAGVRLVGIDTPSVDPFESKTLLAHQELAKAGMRNLEGLDLARVEDGEWELIAIPLRLVGFDASPVRAILRRPTKVDRSRAKV